MSVAAFARMRVYRHNPASGRMRLRTPLVSYVLPVAFMGLIAAKSVIHLRLSLRYPGAKFMSLR